MEIGQKVNDRNLGTGIIVKTIKSIMTKEIIMCLVLFDKTPDKLYNGGNNPCVSFVSDLKVID